MEREEEKFKRSLRRHHKDRMVAKARRIAFLRRSTISDEPPYNSIDGDEWWARKSADNLAVCSCYSCRYDKYDGEKRDIMEKARNSDAIADCEDIPCITHGWIANGQINRLRFRRT
jgi:hypothetical protein